jgi:transcriptional accessory protein Tex/SPT6
MLNVIMCWITVFYSVLVVRAVSLARRLQDPLAELVKVEPKHLGVGMYQHDVPEKQLNCTLDEVVVECVSFVGVDVNIASNFLLR